MATAVCRPSSSPTTNHSARPRRRQPPTAIGHRPTSTGQVVRSVRRCRPQPTLSTALLSNTAHPTYDHQCACDGIASSTYRPIFMNEWMKSSRRGPTIDDHYRAYKATAYGQAEQHTNIDLSMIIHVRVTTATSPTTRPTNGRKSTHDTTDRHLSARRVPKCLRYVDHDHVHVRATTSTRTIPTRSTTDRLDIRLSPIIQAAASRQEQN